jgi:hypothetical protein
VSRFQGKRLLLGCTADSAVLLAGPTSTAIEVLAAVAVHPPPHGSVAGLCGALPDLKPEKPASAASRASLIVTVDDALVRSFVVTPPSGAQGLRELRATVAARFAVLYGESAEQWLLTADWHATAPFIACALPRQLYRGFDSLAQTNGWHLGSVRPALVCAWNREHASIPADGWLVVGFGQTLTLAHTRNAQPAGLRTLRLPDAPALAELATLLEQERLRTPVPAEARHRQSLLWTGTAVWLPAAPTIAGLASRALPLHAQAVSFAGLSEPCQLACQLALSGIS